MLSKTNIQAFKSICEKELRCKHTLKYILQNKKKPILYDLFRIASDSEQTVLNKIIIYETLQIDFI